MIVDAYPFFATWSAQIRPAGFGGYDAAYLPSSTANPAECGRIVESIDDGDCYACNALNDVCLSALVDMVNEADQAFDFRGAIAWGPLWVEHVGDYPDEHRARPQLLVLGHDQFRCPQEPSGARPALHLARRGADLVGRSARPCPPRRRADAMRGRQLTSPETA